MYKDKYLKYESKYLTLKNELDGGSLKDAFKIYPLSIIKKELYQNISYDDKLINKVIAHEQITDPEVIKGILSINGIDLNKGTTEVQNNREIIKFVVKHNSIALQYLSPELKKDKEIVTLAINFDTTKMETGLKNIYNINSSEAFKFADDSLKNDREFLIQVLRINGYVLKAIPKFKNDTEFVLNAVTQNGLALLHASTDLQNNEDVVMAAVTQNGIALQYASISIRGNVKVAIAAVQQSHYAYQYTKCTGKEDEEVHKNIKYSKNLITRLGEIASVKITGKKV